MILSKLETTIPNHSNLNGNTTTRKSAWIYHREIHFWNNLVAGGTTLFNFESIGRTIRIYNRCWLLSY